MSGRDADALKNPMQRYFSKDGQQDGVCHASSAEQVARTQTFCNVVIGSLKRHVP